jgi:hypothetical protein
LLGWSEALERIEKRSEAVIGVILSEAKEA